MLIRTNNAAQKIKIENAVFTVAPPTDKRRAALLKEHTKRKLSKGAFREETDTAEFSRALFAETVQDWKYVDTIDEQGKKVALPCTPENKKLFAKYNPVTVQDVLDAADRLGEVDEAAEEELVKNSEDSPSEQ